MSVSQQHTGPPAPAEVWASGNYAEVCDRMIPRLGARLVELAGVRPGEAVIDVATGSGNAALPAARAGATVTALDITPTLLQTASERAAAAGLRIEWVHGDAQAMPFADGRFDTVLSCVGVQFCSDPSAAAAELVRVCRPGGRIALIAWTREGFIGHVLAAVGKATGGSGTGRSPLDWGSEAGLKELFGAGVSAITSQREDVGMVAASSEDWVDYMAAAYGPLVRARALLQARGEWTALRAELVAIAGDHDTGDGDGFAAHAQYLATVVSR